MITTCHDNTGKYELIQGLFNDFSRLSYSLQGLKVYGKS